nr:GGDEF domain-containing protein [Desulfobulbaceae bacterium]
MDGKAEISEVDDLGRILSGQYSEKLTSRVLEQIDMLRKFEETGTQIMPYMCAWQTDKKVIWYEYAGKQFCDLLRCTMDTLAEKLRAAIIDQRVYRYTKVKHKVEEKIITREELFQSSWKGLREEVEKTGEVDAVYQLSLGGDKAIWLKDQAIIENFEKDGVCVSVGFLSNVTKEMELKDLFEKIGYIDELTRLPKRHILDRILEVSIGNLQRGNIDDFVLMMIDVDHFKKVNDTHGHLAGDYVLSHLAEVMTSTKRKHDEIGRYGGEEFYGLTIGNISLGLKFAERLRQKVAKASFVYEGQKIPITVSIGLASATQLSKPESFSPEQLIFMADKRLYAAKDKGRNCVVCEDL